MAVNKIPQNDESNVTVYFSETDKKFILHSFVLGLHSPWFKASLSEQWSTRSRATVVNGKNHWAYELRFDKGSSIGLLERRTSTEAASSPNSEFIEGSLSKLPDNASESQKKLQEQRVRCITAHQDVIGAIYHVKPSFTNLRFEAAKAAVQEMAKTAEIYGCTDVAKVHIDRYLSDALKEILELCASAPVSMLEVAMAVKSDWIFKEATTNLVGRSNRFFDGAQLQLQELELSEFMESKREELVEQLMRCDFAMLRVQARDEHGGWAMHHAVGYFRQWVTEALDHGRGSGLDPSYAHLYRAVMAFRSTLGIGWEDAVARYLQKLGVPPVYDNVGRMGAELLVVFTDATKIIEPILKDTTQRQAKDMDMYRTLTFMSVEEEELPWIKNRR